MKLMKILKQYPCFRTGKGYYELFMDYGYGLFFTKKKIIILGFGSFSVFSFKSSKICFCLIKF